MIDYFFLLINFTDVLTMTAIIIKIVQIKFQPGMKIHFITNTKSALSYGSYDFRGILILLIYQSLLDFLLDVAIAYMRIHKNTTTKVICTILLSSI